MKKFRFSDGSIIIASTAEEAKEQHKVVAGGIKRKFRQKSALLKKRYRKA